MEIISSVGSPSGCTLATGIPNISTHLGEYMHVCDIGAGAGGCRAAQPLQLAMCLRVQGQHVVLVGIDPRELVGKGGGLGA